MKQANNNEVDLLLRSLAKGRVDSSSLDGEQDDVEIFAHHLDADEMNAYAEGAAPAAARLRYSEHLADCHACRGLVVSLTQAAGAATHYEVSEQASGSGFWRKLGAIFSPSVLRYAVPAVLLTAVIGIALLALRQPQRSGVVAKNDTTIEQPAQSEETTRPVTAPVATPEVKPKSPQSPTLADSSVARNERPEKAAETAPASGAGAGNAVAPPPMSKDASKVARIDSLAELQPGYAQEPKPASAAAPVSQAQADSRAMAKDQSVRQNELERQRGEVFRNQTEDVHGPNRSAAQNVGNSSVMSARRLGGPANNSRAPNPNDKKSKPEDAETRSVAGHQFVHDGNAWIDTNYDSGRSTIGVARGSEQFRALIADEPGLSAIAQQLPGTVIVVWKNRAYRIH
jgi:hypothetical protein